MTKFSVQKFISVKMSKLTYKDEYFWAFLACDREGSE